MGIFSGDGIGVDFGTSNLAIYLSGEGVALRESSCVLTLKSDTQRVLAMGAEAHRMLGRTAEDTMLVNTVLDGAVTDADVAALMALAMTERVTGRRKPMEKARLFLNMPVGLTRVEKQALELTARLMGAKKPAYVKAPLAAALGGGLNVDQPKGVMVAVLGGGLTEIAVLSMNGVVAARSMRTGSLSMDEAIVRYVRRKKGLIIGARTAEDLKCDIGSASLPDYDVDDIGDERYLDAPPEIDEDSEGEEPQDDDAEDKPLQGEKVLLKGRDAKTGLPKTIEVTTRDIALALREPVSILVDALRDALMRTPEELAADVLEEGIHLSGGGALLFGLAQTLAQHTGVPVNISDHPQNDVLLGLGRLIDDERLLRECAESGSAEI